MVGSEEEAEEEGGGEEGEKGGWVSSSRGSGSASELESESKSLGRSVPVRLESRLETERCEGAMEIRPAEVRRR